MAGVPNNRNLVSERVFATLLEALLAGRYVPGEKLPPQRALAADLGVTMTALREALKRLEQMGLIDVRHGDAMRVRDWRAHAGLDVIAHVLFRSGGLDQGVLADVLEARSLMLRELAGLAAERRDEAGADRLGELAGALEFAPDAASAQQVDFAFFTEVAQSAGNLVFVLILNAIRDLYFQHAAVIPVTARHGELSHLYERAARAIAARDAAGARAAVWELALRQQQRVEDGLAQLAGESVGDDPAARATGARRGADARRASSRA